MNIIYLHGLASSGNSETVKLLREIFPEDTVIAPDLPIEPQKAYRLISDIIDKLDSNEDYVIIGSSMGGMYAHQFPGNRILINPSFHVSHHLSNRIGETINFFSKRENGLQSFKITEELVKKYRTFEHEQFNKLEDFGEVVGLFGSHDDVVNCKEEYCNVYSIYHDFDGGHRIDRQTIEDVIKPLIQWFKGKIEETYPTVPFEKVGNGSDGFLMSNNEAIPFKVYRSGYGTNWIKKLEASKEFQTLPDGRISSFTLPEGVKIDESTPLIFGNEYLCNPSVQVYGKDGVMVYDDNTIILGDLILKRSR